MNARDWTPRRRLEEVYQREIFRLLGNYLSIPTAASLGEITMALANWANLQTYLEQSASVLATRMVTHIKQENARSWREAARKGGRGREIYQALQREMQGEVGLRVHQLVEENAQLISSIPAKVRVSANREVEALQQRGYRPESIARYLRQRVPQLTKSRSTLIARTETSKCASALTQARAEDLDLPAYVWSTVDDQRVRASHQLMDNVVVFWNYPPNPERLAGERNVKHGPYNCGDIWNCRCTALPLLSAADISFPHKVFWGGRIQMMTLHRFRNLFASQSVVA
jgi:uncharacterized protein with gpF-like domain